MSVVPLTTTFTPVPTCTADIYTQDIFYSIGGPSPSSCFPSGWTSTSQYFSPGLCPTGYTQACANLVAAGTVTETQATCCPTGYACYTPEVFNFPGQACASKILSEATTTVTNATNNQAILATLHPQTEAVNGYGVSIRYQSTDFISTTSNSAVPSSSSPTYSSTKTTSSSSLGPSTTAVAPSSLSTGARAGIGAGAAVGGLAVLIGIAVLFMARRRKARTARQEVDGKDVGHPPRPEALGKLSLTPKRKAHEVYTQPAELAG